ncbi:MAG TPA: hydroxyacid dehydrogenase [Candidatus Cryosericum sp.]|nr:hydroxyacid dehydrogenase [Candidatus Cryosericum sp.]
MQKVVVAQATNEQILSPLRERAEVTVITNNDANALLSACRDAECLQVGTWVKITEAFLAECPNLKVISRTGVGVDNVDVEAASKRGILVLNTPQANTLSVAEHTMALVLALAKQLMVLDAHTRAGNFEIRRKNLPMDLDGKTLGLIGFGSIGRLSAEKANAAFGMRILAFDPFVKQAEPYVHLAASYAEVVENSDFVSIHLPLLPETRNLFNAEMIAQMKKGAFLINTSRGGIVNEDALASALESGALGGAALDVFESEPPKQDSPLMRAPNLIMTPHAAALTKECVLRVAETAAEGITDYLDGKRPKFIYNAKSLGL